MRENFPFPVVLAKAGTHKAYARFAALWIPAFARTTGEGLRVISNGTRIQLSLSLS
jgi:hypothetical protein